jgi:formylglycine-generating enzyme required for sulfatase activity
VTEENIAEESSQSTNILDDLPTDRDSLDFQPYVDTLVDIIESPNTHTPLTIGVFGTWGSGKTSLMRMVRKGLQKSARVTWFDAWKYEKEESLWRALLLQVLATLRDAVPENDTDESKKGLRELEDLETALYRAVDREELGGVQIDWGKLSGSLAQGALQIGLSFIPGVNTLTKMVEELQKAGSTTATKGLIEAIQRERTQIYVEQIRFLEQFQSRFSQLVKQHIRVKNQRLVVFVDDLDRCLPEKAVEVLEAIKLFMDVPGCIFVLGLDQDVICRGVELKYREFGKSLGVSEEEQQRFLIEGTRYLEKIIQLPFQIPPIEREDMADFVHRLVAAWPHQGCPEIFAEGLGSNPRQIKRTVNVFLLLWGLQKRREKLQGMIKPLRLAKVVAIQHIYPQLYEVLKRTPRLLCDLEEYYRAESPPPQQVEGRAEGESVEPPPILASFIHRAAVRRLLTMHPLEMPEANFSSLKPSQLRLYFTLTRRAETPEVDKTVPEAFAGAVFEPQLVRIPAGSFLMGSTREQAEQAVSDGLDKSWAECEQPRHTVTLSEYWIGKYPVTNAEYQYFIKDVGHDPPRHWDGQEYPEEKSDHPVVYVSWDDAQAYCEWLSEKTNREYRLPTEAEWEKAARGQDGRIYPWGDEWDQTRLNSAEGGAGDTTPVGQFSPTGDSPYGVVDMAGNVWEWCADWFDEITYKGREGQIVQDPKGSPDGSSRVVRGGAFSSDLRLARCAYRYGLYPSRHSRGNGFRVVVCAPS